MMGQQPLLTRQEQADVAPGVELTPQQKLEARFSPKQVLKDVLASGASFGFRGVFVAAHYAGLNLIVSSMGDKHAAATSLITTIQGLLVATSSGLLLATGLELAGTKSIQNSEERNVQMSAVIRTGWLMAAALGGLTTAAFLSTRGTLPLFAEEDVAKIAADYLSGFALASFPDLFIWTNGQIVAKMEPNKPWFPLVTNISYRMPALALSYVLAKHTPLGVFGAGLGAAISGWINVLGWQKCFSGEAYRALDLYNFRMPLDELKKRVIAFFKSGWKLALQRDSEWGLSQLIITISALWAKASHESSTDADRLVASQLPILMITVCGLLSQGWGQAAMLMAKEDFDTNKRLLTLTDKHPLTQLDVVEARHRQQRLLWNTYMSNLGSLGSNLLVGGMFYALRPQLRALFMPENVSQATIHLSQHLQDITLASVIPDSLRIVTGGALRGWYEDLLYPTLASLILMSGFGVGAGSVWGLEEGRNIVPLHIMRLVTLCLAMAFNFYRVGEHAKADEALYQQSSALVFIDKQKDEGRLAADLAI